MAKAEVMPVRIRPWANGSRVNKVDQRRRPIRLFGERYGVLKRHLV